MLVKDLIEILKQHNPEAEVHVVNDRGYYDCLFGAACLDTEAWQHEAMKGMTDEEIDEKGWPEPPDCDGSCHRGSPVVIPVD